MHGKGMKEDDVYSGRDGGAGLQDIRSSMHTICIQACIITIGPGLDACMAIATYHGGGC